MVDHNCFVVDDAMEQDQPVFDFPLFVDANSGLIRCCSLDAAITIVNFVAFNQCSYLDLMGVALGAC